KRTIGCAYALGRHEVLVRDRQAGERRLALHAVHGFGRLQRPLGQEGDDGVHLRVDALDLGDEGLHDFRYRKLARVDLAGKAFCLIKTDLVHRPAEAITSVRYRIVPGCSSTPPAWRWACR